MTADKRQTEYEAAFNHGAGNAPLAEVGSTIFAVLPEGYTATDLRAEKFQPQPAAIRAKVTLADVASFVGYVNEFKIEGEPLAQTTLFAKREDSSVTAILDYHGDRPSWCSHKAHLTLKASPEWAAWQKLHNRQVPQFEFATFLEDRYVDLIDPDGATMLEMASNLEARASVNFKSAKNLQNGTIALEYVEEIEGKGTAGGHLTIPKKFTIRLPIYYRGEPIELVARLRYKIQDTKLSFTVVFERLDTILDDAFAQVLETIHDGTGLTAFLGHFEAQNNF